MSEKDQLIKDELMMISDMDSLCRNSIALIKYARGLAVQHINIIELMTNYALGRWIVEEQQNGKDRAEYGTAFTLFAIEKNQTAFTQSRQHVPFNLSWSHYLVLMRIKNLDERSFYEIEAAKSGWNVITLQRQYASSLYCSIRWCAYG